MNHILVLEISLVSIALALYGLFRQIFLKTGGRPSEPVDTLAGRLDYTATADAVRGERSADLPPAVPDWPATRPTACDEMGDRIDPVGGDRENEAEIAPVARDPDTEAPETEAIVVRLTPAVLRDIRPETIETRPCRDGSGLDIYMGDLFLAHVPDVPSGQRFDLCLEPLPG